MTTKATAQMGGLTREEINQLCDDLKAAMLHWRGDSRWEKINQLCDLALQAIDRWIPVGERLPDPKGPCVVLYGDNDHTTGSGVGIPFCASNPEYAHKHAIDHHYTHWLPLPPPPERP